MSEHHVRRTSAAKPKPESSALRTLPPDMYSMTSPRYRGSVLTTPRTRTVRGECKRAIIRSSVLNWRSSRSRPAAVHPTSDTFFRHTSSPAKVPLKTSPWPPCAKGTSSTLSKVTSSCASVSLLSDRTVSAWVFFVSELARLPSLFFSDESRRNSFFRRDESRRSSSFTSARSCMWNSRSSAANSSAGRCAPTASTVAASLDSASTAVALDSPVVCTLSATSRSMACSIL
mmetsp:Transcript_7479/g.20861  ORF Transcript_7479/g.20861 Transcript_7479/m.20861 type:complete len:230 (+) Transcript_7479:655-1344(+)